MSNSITKPAEGGLARQTAGAVNTLLKKNASAIMATLPKGFNYDRMCRSLINAISTTPTIAQCSPDSIFLASIRAFSLGLEPNGALKEGYLVPFWNAKKRCNEAQFMPSYIGLQNLARRSGEITEIYSVAVCEKDEFDIRQGTDRRITHKPEYKQGRGDAVCYYAVFKTKGGGVDFEVMTVEEIDKVRKTSKASSSGPWVDWYDEMAKKTVMRRLLKRAPMSIEVAGAVSLDNQLSGSGEIVDDIIDVEAFDVSDAATPAEVQTAVNAERTEELKKKLADREVIDMINGEISRSKAPITAEDVTAYADSVGVMLSIDSDFKKIVKAAAENSLL